MTVSDINIATMKLSFKATSLPLAAVGVHSALKLTPALLLDSTSSSTTKLHVGDKHVIEGEQSIMRFFARLNAEGQLSKHALYPEHQFAQVASVDEWLAKCYSTTDKSILASLNDASAKLKSGDFLVDKSCTLADYALWSRMFQLKQSNAWVDSMSALPECQHALQLLNASSTFKSTPDGTQTSDTSDIKMDAVSRNVLDVFRMAVAREFARVSPVKDVDLLYSYIEMPRGLGLDLPDMCIPVPRLRLKGNPNELAAQFATAMQPNKYLERIEGRGPFVNLYLKSDTLKQLLIPQIIEHRDQFGGNDIGKGKNVIVEFSSPNIAKPFHAGHLRSTILGNFVRNVCKVNGMNVTTINYLGDWGKQYGLLAVGYEKYGDEELLLEDAIHHLYTVYVKINADVKEDPAIDDQARAYFKRMEDGDEKSLAMWSKFRALSIERYKKIYARLNVEFDVYSGESQYGDGMKRVMTMLEEKNLLTESEGAKIIDLTPHGLNPAIVQKKDGTTLYLTRDIAAAWERQETYKFDQMYYVVGAQQDSHFQQLFKILELSGFDWSKNCAHLNFGMVKGMSTRKGTVVFLEDILEEAYQVMHEVMKKNEKKYALIPDPQKVADIIGMSAVIIQDMGAKRHKDYSFNWSRMTSFEGDTGPYLQYSHARLCSIERKYLKTFEGFNEETWKSGDLPPFAFRAELAPHMMHPKLHNMALALAQYSDVIRNQPERNFEPTTIVSYLMDLCHKVSSAVEELYVSGQEPDVAQARFWMFWSAKTCICNGMKLLGLRPVERM